MRLTRLQWIYPFASTIDKPDLPLVPEGVELISILRDSCPNYVPIPQDSKSYPSYGPGEGIEVSLRSPSIHT